MYLRRLCFKNDVCLNKNQLSDYDIILGACHLSGAHLEEKAVTGNSRLTVSQRQGPSCFSLCPGPVYLPLSLELENQFGLLTFAEKGGVRV